jgi:hypothetical protein
MSKMLSRLAIVCAGVVMFAGVAMASSTTVDVTCGSACDWGGDGPFIGNDGTGFHSLNVAMLKVWNDLFVKNDNDYDADNDVDAKIETGDNKIFGGTSGHHWCQVDADDSSSDIDTGDADAVITIHNKGNSNETMISVDGVMLPSVVNTMTGADSENRASAYIKYDTTVINDNDADVDNDVDVCVSTGDNSAMFNTGASSITTGDASVTITIENDLNSNVTEIH